jgi:hypothetical protein
MFSKQDVLNAYRYGAQTDMVLEAESRIGSRSMPLGGLWAGLKRLGNAVYSPIRLTGALILGYDAPEPLPAMPELPKEFAGSELEKSFTQSWKLNAEVLDNRIEGFNKLLDFDIGGWWKQSSVASHGEYKDAMVNFPEEGAAMTQGSDNSASTWVDLISRGVSAATRSR